MKNNDELILEFEEALLNINRFKVAEIFEECYLSGNGFDLLENLTISSLEKIGEKWMNGSVSLSQVYMSGVICEELIEKYLPKLDIKRKVVPKIAIGVLQDHHALGKRIVYSVLRAGGFEVLDFGYGLGVDDLVEKTVEENVEILFVSTLMLPSALKVKELSEKLKKLGSKAKIIAGGAPFRLDSTLWEKVGADADGKNASNVIDILETMLKGMDK